MIVLESTRRVVDAARYLSIDADATARWAESAIEGDLRPTGHGLLAQVPGDARQAANFMLLIDALNFCFWNPRPRFVLNETAYTGFEALLAALITAARAEARWFDPRFWIDLSPEVLRRVLGPAADMPMLDDRAAIARATGQTLIERFDGQFELAIESVNGRASSLAMLLLANFDSFRDVAEYSGQPVFLAKRAQITALDVSIVLESKGYAGLDGLESLTAFADYRLPQALRHLGVLRLANSLADRIDSESEIPAGSPEEVELRAATIWAVELMRQALDRRSLAVPSWQIDWYLWNRARQSDVRIPHHRTRTIYY